MLSWRGEGSNSRMGELVELLVEACGGGEGGSGGLFAWLLGVHLGREPARGGCWLRTG